MRALFIEHHRRVSRVAQKRRERIFVLGALVFVMALFLFTLVVYLSYHKEWQVHEVEIKGSALVSRSELSARTDAILEGSYLFLFPKRNTVLLPFDEIEETLLTEFPALEQVSVQRDSFSRILITVSEREPFVLWCPSDVIAEEGYSACFFVDSEGFIFAEAPDISSDMYVRFVGPAFSSQGIGSSVFAPGHFREFALFLQSLRESALFPRQVVIEEGVAGVPDFSIVLVSGARLLVSGSGTLEQALSDIKAFFGDPEIVKAGTAFLQQVAYIDFRFENKVYYKMRP